MLTALQIGEEAFRIHSPSCLRCDDEWVVPFFASFLGGIKTSGVTAKFPASAMRSNSIGKSSSASFPSTSSQPVKPFDGKSEHPLAPDDIPKLSLRESSPRPRRFRSEWITGITLAGTTTVTKSSRIGLPLGGCSRTGARE